MTEDDLKFFAGELIRQAVEDVEFLDVIEELMDPYSFQRYEAEEVARKVCALLSSAKVTVSWDD